MNGSVSKPQTNLKYSLRRCPRRSGVDLRRDLAEVHRGHIGCWKPVLCPIEDVESIAAKLQSKAVVRQQLLFNGSINLPGAGSPEQISGGVAKCAGSRGRKCSGIDPVSRRASLRREEGDAGHKVRALRRCGVAVGNACRTARDSDVQWQASPSDRDTADLPATEDLTRHAAIHVGASVSEGKLVDSVRGERGADILITAGPFGDAACNVLG